jgi:hypothetical protein
MRKSILFFFIIWCNIGYTLLAQTNESVINPASTSATWFQHRELKLLDKSKNLQYYQITKGQNWVFQYTYKAADIAEIADDEFSESIFIEIPQNKDKHFSKKLGLKKQKAIFLKSCYCLDAGPVQIKKGSIKAKKINDKTWHVIIKIKVPDFDAKQQTKFKKIETDFILQEP